MRVRQQRPHFLVTRLKLGETLQHSQRFFVLIDVKVGRPQEQIRVLQLRVVAKRLLQCRDSFAILPLRVIHKPQIEFGGSPVGPKLQDLAIGRGRAVEVFFLFSLLRRLDQRFNLSVRRLGSGCSGKRQDQKTQPKCLPTGPAAERGSAPFLRR